MKSLLYKAGICAGIAMAITSCKKNGDDDGPQKPAETEFKHVRVLVVDAASSKLTQITPADGKLATFDALFPNASVYKTASGRYAALLYGTQNAVQFFDSGLEYHGDHVDIKGTPKFGAIGSNSLKPTHFKSRGLESIIFNDGEGTLSRGNENDFHTPGAKMNSINAGLEPHHGAMAQFDNGTYAVTVFDKSSALAGPHGVKIIDGSGAQKFAVKLAVSRIHGNATDGTNAVFGANGGALVVNANGEQRLIPNPDGFGDVRIGTILEAPAVKKFIGFTNLKGAYFIDLATNKMLPIVESTDIMQCKVDNGGKNLLVLLSNGNLKMYDLASGQLKKEGNVLAATPSSQTVKPVLEATARFAYITLPTTGEVYQVSLNDLSSVIKHKVSGQPAKLALLGFETDESH